MAGNDYYRDLIDLMRTSSAAATSDEIRRIERIEKGRAEEAARAMTNSPLFTELQKQTQLNMATIIQQERQIQELRNQNAKLEAQLDILMKADEASSKQARKSVIGFAISTVIALASLIVAIIAIVI